MYYRTIQENLITWKKKPQRKPLILRGARQVGKTTVVNLFAKEFDTFVALNLELYEDRRIFRDEYNIHDILQAIQVVKNVSFAQDRTLIFIDEIQNSAQAIKMLRYFYEARPDLFVIAAGSLLELILEKEALSFPVGRVEYLYLYPFTFNEFLKAKNENILVGILNSGDIPGYAHEKLLKLFHEYTLIGGMPEVIKTYLANNDVVQLKSVYESLLISYTNDADKYARNHTMKNVIRHCLDSLPYEVGKRIKFQGFGASDYKSREVGEALRAIEKSMLISLIFPVINTELPLITDHKKSPKLQFFDTGIINYFAKLQLEFFTFDNLSAIYKGLIAEHIVRQEIIASDYTQNAPVPIWTRESKASNAEVDIVIQYQGIVLPLEVKSGKSGSLKSLHQFLKESTMNVALRLYGGLFKVEDCQTPEGKKYRLINLPFYCAGNLMSFIRQYV
jgi:predicted AAA+ superfamily ATPase